MLRFSNPLWPGLVTLVLVVLVSAGALLKAPSGWTVLNGVLLGIWFSSFVNTCLVVWNLDAAFLPGRWEAPMSDDRAELLNKIEQRLRADCRRQAAIIARANRAYAARCAEREVALRELSRYLALRAYDQKLIEGLKEPQWFCAADSDGPGYEHPTELLEYLLDGSGEDELEVEVVGFRNVERRWARAWWEGDGNSVEWEWK